MADQKLTDLTVLPSDIAAGDLFYVVRSGVDYQANANLLGGAALLDVGTTAGTVAAGDDSRFTDSRAPTGSAGGDLTGTYPNPTIKTSVDLTTPDINSATADSLQAGTTSSGLLLKNRDGVTVASFGVGGASSTNIALSGPVALGTNNITMTGSIASTGARVTKVWATDVESTNAPTVGGTAVVVTGGALGTPSSGTLTSCTGLPVSTGISGLGTGVATALAVNVGSAGAPVVNGGALGTPSSGSAANLTSFPTLNQNTTGSAASLSVAGQTGLVTLTGITSTNRAKTVRDAADTLLELGGSYTPTGTWTNLTLVTPALGTPASGVMTNVSGTAKNLTAGGSPFSYYFNFGLF